MIYPAIDIKTGCCVRLRHGDFAQKTIYNEDAGAQAQQFVAAGAEWVHVVDLDGAVAKKPVNVEAVDAILASGVEVQLGGGIRDMASIAYWLEPEVGRGVARVILGTAALKNPKLVKEAVREFPEKIVVGADARDGMVAAEGWLETSEISVLDLVRRFEDCGVAAVIFTDIGRDGDLSGANHQATCELAESVSIPIIASGGVASLADVAAFADTAVAGVIIGRALYEGRIDLAEAIKKYGGAKPC